jgi:large subunit ribosomal protein L25
MTKEKHEVKAQIRKVLGKKVKKIRKEGFIPATIYGKRMESVSIQIEAKEFAKIFAEVGESGVVELLVDETKYPVLFKNPQYDPITSEYIHIDCHKVNLKEKIKASIAVELIGESDAVKAGNILVEVTDEIEVEALPNDLPENFTIDLATLTEVDQMITVADLKIDKSKVEILTPEDTVIVKTEAPRVEEVIEEETPSPEDVPATEEKTEEGKEGENVTSEKKEED